MKTIGYVSSVIAVTVVLGCLIVNVNFAQGCDDLLKGDLMSAEEWNAYLSCLENELNQIKGELGDIDVEQLEQALQGARGEREAVQERVDALNAELDKLNTLIAEIEALPTEYTVQSGDYLAGISARPDIYNDRTKWTRIYHENKAKGSVRIVGSTKTTRLRSPNMIYPNWILKIPRDWPDEITVVRGDCLWKIAGYWWVFNKASDWTYIYAKNKSKLRYPNNPDLIYPDDEFVIPRGTDERPRSR